VTLRLARNGIAVSIGTWHRCPPEGGRYETGDGARAGSTVSGEPKSFAGHGVPCPYEVSLGLHCIELRFVFHATILVHGSGRASGYPCGLLLWGASGAEAGSSKCVAPTALGMAAA